MFYRLTLGLVALLIGSSAANAETTTMDLPNALAEASLAVLEEFDADFGLHFEKENPSLSGTTTTGTFFAVRTRPLPSISAVGNPKKWFEPLQKLARADKMPELIKRLSWVAALARGLKPNQQWGALKSGSDMQHLQIWHYTENTATIDFSIRFAAYLAPKLKTDYATPDAFLLDFVSLIADGSLEDVAEMDRSAFEATSQSFQNGFSIHVTEIGTDSWETADRIYQAEPLNGVRVLDKAKNLFFGRGVINGRTYKVTLLTT